MGALLNLARGVPGVPRIVAAVDDFPSEMFTFHPSGESDNVPAIVSECRGKNPAQALQEARWAAHREQCWQGFLSNASRVLAAPEAKREGLLTRYRVEAVRRYGQQAGSIMAEGLCDWVSRKGVH